MTEEMPCRKRRLSSFQIIILGFAGVILLGALLLMLPLSTTAGCVTPFHEALFTATSAVCVTGLVVQDTGSYWSGFGQAVILTLIQIGGLGVVTVAASVALLSGRRISLMQRSTMQDAISAPKVGGIVRLTRFILRGTFLIELVGALVMLPVFCRDYGWHGIWMAVFHSVSAFCNAGFDILGTNNNLYPSLTGYVQNPVINITIMLLIITGGIGFLTWDDICENKLHFHRYRMQSKVILVTTLTLIVLPALFFFFADFDALPLGERIQAALFQSVTPRTAGFDTVPTGELSPAGGLMTLILMMTGGNSGSQACVTVIRGISLDEIEFRDIFKVVWKEIRVAVLCGICLAIACFGKIMLVDHMLLKSESVTTWVALVVSLSMAVTVFLAKLVGGTLPLLAKKLGFDPAVMASPIITTIVDFLSLLVYFTFATTILHIG